MRITLLLLLSLFACGGAPLDLDAEADAIRGGRRDHRHDAVGQLGRDWPASWTCTGTLISPQIVLTAAHCLFDERGRRMGPGRLVFDDGVEIHEISATSTQRYAPDSEGPWNDIAIVRLHTESSVEPMGIAYAPLRRGQAATVVGFGVTRATGPQRGVGGGVRRSASIRLDYVDDRELAYASDERGSCYGDSGGPLLVREDGVERVAGVTSRGTEIDCSGFAIATRVSAFGPWVERALR